MTRPARRAASMLLVAALIIATGVVWLRLGFPSAAASEWPGVDEAVIGSFAKAAGVGEPAFAIDWVRGDMLLFAFLCAGLIAGGTLGYFAHALFGSKREVDAAARAGAGHGAGS